MIKIIGEALYEQGKMTEKETNDYLIEFMTAVLVMLKVDVFSFKNEKHTEQLAYLVDCKVNFVCFLATRHG